MADGVLGYGIGAEEVDPLGTKCLAKCVTHKGIETFYVRKNNRFLFNPWDMYENDPGTKSYDISMRKWEFRVVTKQVFDWYVQYIKTRNERFLRAAEMQLI